MAVNRTAAFYAKHVDGGGIVWDVTHPDVGATGDGVVDEVAAFTVANGKPGTRHIPPGTYRFASDLTLTGSYWPAPGALLKPDSGVEITIDGPFDAGPYQVFDTSAGGTIAFGAGAVERVLPQWWGAVGDGVTDDADAIQAAANAIATAGGGVVFLPVGTYLTSQQIVVPDNVAIQGAGESAVTVTYTGPNTQAFTTAGDYYTQLLGGFTLTGASLTGGGSVQFHESRLLSRYSGHRLVPVCAVVRYSSGSWIVQDDANHTPVGISGVAVVGDRVRLLYDFTAKEVLGLTITPDDALLEKGYIVSGSGVGLTSAEFKYARLIDIYGFVWWNGSQYVIDYENDTEYGVSTSNPADADVRISHTADVLVPSTVPIQVSPRQGGYIPHIGNFGEDFFDIEFYDYAGNKVTVPDANCKAMYRRSGYVVPDVNGGYPYSDGNFWVVGLMKV